jgi:transposase InsO family protein
LKVSRSGLYYEPEPTSPEELALMRRIDELHLQRPCFGSRMLADALRKEGREVNRKRVQRLMRLMGIESMAPKPKTSEPHPEHVRQPVPPSRARDFQAEPGLGDGHHVHPDEGRLRVPRRDHRLVLAARAVVAPAPPFRQVVPIV